MMLKPIMEHRDKLFWLIIALLLHSSLWAADRNIIGAWNDAALRGVRDSRLPAPEVARALAIVNTCMYDAWAAYDDHASGTQLKDVLRRPAFERTAQNREEAISYAAFRALTDVLPVDNRSVYIPLIRQLGFEPANATTDITKASGIGNVACAAVLEYRHHDKANQLGDLSPGPYTDWTGYVPRNKPTAVPAFTLQSCGGPYMQSCGGPYILDVSPIGRSNR